MRPGISRVLRTLAAGSSIALALAACGGGGTSGGSDKGGGDQAESKAPLLFGTTDAFNVLDPAGSYDNPAWEMQYNVMQTLLSIPAGGATPKPDAAQKCEFSDPKTYTCTMKDGLVFSDGSKLTSEDVKFSFDRMLKIADPNGPSSIFADALASTEAPDPKTVTFHLKFPDATWPMRLTCAAASIVPNEKYPADKLQPNKVGSIIGSGVYKVTKYDPSQQIVLEPNDKYKGDKKVVNGKVLVQVYKDEASLKSAVESGEVEVAYRTMTPTLLADIDKNGAAKKTKLVKGAGTGISYMVFNLNKPPFDKKEVRQAVASLLDRKAIASNVYNDTVTPLWSLVPNGIAGATTPFKDMYGEKPDTAKAKQLLQKAGVKTPISTTLWYNTEHYGEASADMYGEIKRQLEASGLFKIQLKSTAWAQYQKDYAAGAYPVYQLGWYPDFPDPDNYVSPFFATNSFIDKHGYGYSSKQMDSMLTQEKSTNEAAKRTQLFDQIQKTSATDAPMIPIWQDNMIAAVRDGVTGVDKTFDPLYTFRFWLVDASKAQQ